MKNFFVTLFFLVALTTTAKAQIPFPDMPQCGPDPLHGPSFSCFNAPHQRDYANSMRGVDRPFDRPNPYNINV
ncbi:MAG: hypothetical protein IJ934_03360, partial [Acetobacter sp.]|nr:hypothetical protein [Acetobacter sp.]